MLMTARAQPVIPQLDAAKSNTLDLYYQTLKGCLNAKARPPGSCLERR